MIRTFLGSLLALIGATAAVWSPFRAWYGGRHGSRFRVDDLFTGTGVTQPNAALLGSLFLPMSFAAVLTLLGVLLRSRVVVAAAGLIILAITTLWMVRQAQAAGSLTAGGPGLDTGVAAAVSAAALLLLAAFVLPRPQLRLDGEPQPKHETDPPYSPPPPPYPPGSGPPTLQLPPLTPDISPPAPDPPIADFNPPTTQPGPPATDINPPGSPPVPPGV